MENALTVDLQDFIRPQTQHSLLQLDSQIDFLIVKLRSDTTTRIYNGGLFFQKNSRK